MSHRLSIARLLSHALALGCGVLLASTLANRSLFTLAPPARQLPLPPPRTTARAALDSPSSTVPGMGKSALYQEAWARLRAQPLNRQQRADRQFELLRQWAEFDPEAAMQASLADGYIPVSWERGQSSYADAFAEIFRDRPIETLKILTSGRLNGDLFILFDTWIGRVAAKSPQLLLSLAPDLPPDSRRRILPFLMGEDDPAGRLQAMATLSSGLDAATALDFFSPSLTEKMTPFDRLSAQERNDRAESFRQRWLALPDGPQRHAALAEWAFNAGNCRAEDFEAGWQQIPAADRALAARAMVTIMPHNAATQPAVLDHAVEFGLWQEILSDALPVLANHESPTIYRKSEEDPDDPFALSPPQLPADHSLLDWALKLPDRPESRMLLQTIAAGDQDAVAPLMSLPPGDWRRELGLTQRILQHSDSSEAATAYAALTDPRRKAAVDDDRQDHNLPPIPPPAIPDH